MSTVLWRDTSISLKIEAPRAAALVRKPDPEVAAGKVDRVVASLRGVQLYDLRDALGPQGVIATM